MDCNEETSEDLHVIGREESFSEQVSPVSNPKIMHKREGTQQHLFIEIPANDSAQDVCYFLFYLYNHSGNEVLKYEVHHQ